MVKSFTEPELDLDSCDASRSDFFLGVDFFLLAIKTSECAGPENVILGLTYFPGANFR